MLSGASLQNKLGGIGRFQLSTSVVFSFRLFPHLSFHFESPSVAAPQIYV